MSSMTVNEYWEERRRKQNEQALPEAIPHTPKKYEFGFGKPAASQPVELKLNAPYTVTDFKNDPEIHKAYEIVLNYLSKDKDFLSTVAQSLDYTDPEADTDPVEFLRDDVSRLESAGAKALALRNAPEEVKAAYRLMRKKFSNAEITGVKEWGDFVTDYGADALFNVENAAFIGGAALSGLGSFGSGAVAALAGRLGAAKVASKAIDFSLKAKKLGEASAITPTLLKSTGYGGAYAGGQNIGEQWLQKNIGEKGKFDFGELATASTFGAAMGAGVHIGVGSISKHFQKRAIEDMDRLLPAPEKITDSPPPNTIRTVDAQGNVVEKPFVPVSREAIAFKIELEKLIENSQTGGDRFKSALGRLLQERQDAPENFRVAIQEAIASNQPAARITKLLNEVTKTEQRAVLENLKNALINAHKAKEGLSQPAAEFEQILSTAVNSFINKNIDEINSKKPGKEIIPYEPGKEVDALEGLQELVNLLGGGQRTFEELVDVTIASRQKTSKTEAVDGFLNDVYKVFTRLTSSHLFGKAGGFLAPYTKQSPTAKLLLEKTNTEFQMGWSSGQKTIDPDFAENLRFFEGELGNVFNQAVRPINANNWNSKLGDEMNAALSLALRGRSSTNETYGAAINESAIGIRRAYQAVGQLLSREKLISTPVQGYVPRMWKRSAIEKNPNEFNNLLVKHNEAKNLAEAEKIRQKMLSVQDEINLTNNNYFFSSSRAFNNIKDDADFEKFLNTDVRETFSSYMNHAAMALAKKKTFGVANEKEFLNKWGAQIQRELPQGSWGKAQQETLADLYRSMTGEGMRVAGTANQAVQLLYRGSLLPFATIGSLTEILLNLGVAGGSASMRGFKDAVKITGAKNKRDIQNLLDANNIGIKLITEGSFDKLTKELGHTPEEALAELQRFRLVLEQSVESMSDRLAGDTFQNEKLQTANNWFFRGILLDQWTKFVQNVSFQSGKHYINDTVQEVVNFGNAPMTRRMQAKLDDLAEFGVNLKGAKQWVFNGSNRDDPYYQEILRGAARYANQIILQPSKASGLKPRAFNTPLGLLAYQLLGYPVAFTNNILKRGAKRLVRDKDIAARALVPTALAMTAVGATTNYIRSRGEAFKDKTPTQVAIDGTLRWGGGGIFLDQINRALKTAEYAGPVGLVTGMFGPISNDIMNLYKRSAVAETVGTKVPGYGAGNFVVGKENMQEYKRYLRRIDREIKRDVDELVGKEKATFAKGGIVENVPNVPSEPDERIDKMTGLPYDQQAGEAFMDEEDPSRSLLARNT